MKNKLSTKSLRIISLALLSIFSAQRALAESDTSFEKMLNDMMIRSFDREQAKAATDLAHGQGIVAAEMWSPQVNVVGKESRSKIEDTFSSGRSVGVLGSLNLFRFGADHLAKSAAKLDEDAARELESSVRLEVQSKSAKLLLRYLRLLFEQDIAKESVVLRQRSLDIANTRFKSGQIPSQEVQKVEIDLELARGNLSTTETALHQTLLDIAVATQQPPIALQNFTLERRWPWQSQISQLIQSSQKDVDYVEVLKNRPDYVVNQHRLKAAGLRIDEARRRSLPALDLALGYDINRDNSEEVIQRGWNGLMTLTIPLNDAGITRSAVLSGIAREKSLEIEASSIRTELPNALASTRQALTESHVSAQSRERILSVSEKLHDNTLARFQRGLISANELNDDYRRLLDTKMAAISGWSDAHERMLEYCQARGKILADCR